VQIRDLEYFLACSKAGSFTAAAREVHIVQSAMSSAIARLEHDLGVSLFDRSVTPVAVTEHGAALQAAAQRILDAVQAARDDVAAVSGQVRGTVILGCTLSTGPLDLGAVLADLRDRHPDVIIKLRQSLTGSAGNLQAVQDGSMDIALTAGALQTGPGQPGPGQPGPGQPGPGQPGPGQPGPGQPGPGQPGPGQPGPGQPGPGQPGPGQPGPGQPGPGQAPRGVILTPLVSETLVFVCPADHPLSRRPSVTAADLADETILRFPPGWSVRDTVDRVFGTVSSAVEIADYTLMLKLVEGHFGTTLMPASAIAAGPAGPRAVPVDDARLRWSLSAAISASRPRTAATTAVLRALSQAAAPFPG
jgi:DNA-binding transcriptional LysR family regulator